MNENNKDNVLPMLSRATLDTMITHALTHPQSKGVGFWGRLIPANDWKLPAGMTGIAAAVLIALSATFYTVPQTQTTTDLGDTYAELSDYMVADLMSL